MLVKTIGKPTKRISIKEIKEACKFYADYLMGTKLANKIYLTVEFEQYEKGSDEYASCDWTDTNHYPREFEINIACDLSKKDTMLVLAHEMTHLAQYAKGDMKDMMRPARMIKWQNDLYDCEFDYWSAPWEREARGMEMELYVKYLQCKKRK